MSETRRTLNSHIGCVGVGLHSGQKVQMTFAPAAKGLGWHITRQDLGVRFPVSYEWAAETVLSTTLRYKNASISTTEHVFAALVACGVDDVEILIDGPEMPILDGSAAPFVFLLESAGFNEQIGAKSYIEILHPVRVEHQDSWAELRPSTRKGLRMRQHISFPNSCIGDQTLTVLDGPVMAKKLLVDSRTFVQAKDIAALQSKGLALGGSLDNAIVIDGYSVLNPEGLRHPQECVRHKMLDALGDLALAGAPIWGAFTGHRSGHALNVALVQKLFQHPSHWQWSQQEGVQEYSKAA